MTTDQIEDVEQTAKIVTATNEGIEEKIDRKVILRLAGTRTARGRVIVENARITHDDHGHRHRREDGPVHL